jgi:hypothetical protein
MAVGQTGKSRQRYMIAAAGSVLAEYSREICNQWEIGWFMLCSGPVWQFGVCACGRQAMAAAQFDVLLQVRSDNGA